MSIALQLTLCSVLLLHFKPMFLRFFFVWVPNRTEMKILTASSLTDLLCNVLKEVLAAV